MTQETVEIAAPRAKDHKEELYTAKPWQLIWRRFSKHVLAVASLWFLAILALCAVFAEQVAPYDPFKVSRLRTLAPPTGIHLFYEGQFVGPFVYGLARERDLETARVLYETDTETRLPVQLFFAGDDYSFFGLFTTNLHLFGVDDRREQINLLGTDDLGRDVFSRLIHGARVTLSAGLIGVVFAFVLGLTLGSISGYFGGWIDSAIQRLMEFIRSIPTIPLWMGLAAALPIA
ncbi:MAG: peptide ABC transporter permease, partial [Rhizobiales bacterium 32-66-8]